MKKLYSGALSVASLLLFSLTSSGQAIYTAVQPGNWHTPTGPGIWAAAEPPPNCSNCTIVLDVNGTINLNTTINMTTASAIKVASGTTLAIGNSAASGFANSYSIILVNDGTNSTLNVASGGMVDATQAGTYDGILTSFTSGGSTTYFKKVGNAPAGFVNNTPADAGNPAGGNTVNGPVTLSSSGTLPVILSRFTATVGEGAIDLAWTTSMEANSDHFTVQVSSNAGEKWDDLATIAAAGNSASPINYAFTDSHPSQGTSEFRLQLVDRDGRVTYSDVKSVRIGMVSAVSAYPNPASDYVNVTLSGMANLQANIRLVNLAGQVLLEKNVTNAAGTTVALAVSSFPAGNYLVVVTGSDGSQQTSKILIAR
ncbi:MAG TPA: T9SS type A sorting domain-containing protein [Puia sp.]|nr:T9SS type A sorting domain-containing protein [Puia sp.]